MGTVWGGWYKWNEDQTDTIFQYPPTIIDEKDHGYFQLFPRYLSLGCRGKKVELQAVYKLIDAGEEQNGSGPYYAGLDIGDGQNMTKCHAAQVLRPERLMSTASCVQMGIKRAQLRRTHGTRTRWFSIYRSSAHLGTVLAPSCSAFS